MKRVLGIAIPLVLIILMSGCSQQASQDNVNIRYCESNDDCVLVGERCCGKILNRDYAKISGFAAFPLTGKQVSECSNTCSEYTIECINNRCSLSIEDPQQADLQVQSPQQVNADLREAKEGPLSRVNEAEILVYGDRVVIDRRNIIWSAYTDTDSMLPVLNAGSNGLEVIPISEEEIAIGDIITYSPTWTNGLIVHRVIELGQDELGWYAITKGDNNPKEDPEKVRFSQVEGILIGVIY